MLTRNNILLDTDELAYTQYFDISNDITIPINNNNIDRVPIAEKNIQDMILLLIGSLDKVSPSEPKTNSFDLDTLQNMIKVIKHHKLVSQNSIQINNLGQDPMKDVGNFSTMPKRYHNTMKLREFGKLVF